MFENSKIPDVVLKIPNLWLGIGDKFLVSGTDFNNAEDLEQIIFEDKERNYGVFQLLILIWYQVSHTKTYFTWF